MIIWTGYGILLPFIVAGAIFGARFGADAYFGPGYTEAHHWVVGAGVALGGLLSWLIGSSLYRKGTQTLRDPSSGRDVHLSPSHTLFFIPMHWAGFLLMLAAIPAGIYGIPKTDKQRLREELAKTEATTPPPKPETAPPVASKPSDQPAQPAIQSGYASVLEAQHAAMKRYPDLASAGSKFNVTFVELHNEAKTKRPGLLKENDWPMVLANEVAQKLK